MINKLLYLMAFVGTLGFASCEDDTSYDAAPQVDGSKPMVYFGGEMPSMIHLGYTQESFSIKVNRCGASDLFLANVNVEIADEELATKFDFPTSVTFPEGVNEGELKVTVSLDGANELPAGIAVPVKLTLTDKDNLFPYGVSTYAFEVVRDAPFKSLGMGIYYDDLMSNFVGGFPVAKWQVEVQQSELNDKIYRVKNVYTAGSDFFKVGLGGALGAQAAGYEKDTYIEINCSDASAVKIPAQMIGCKLAIGANGAMVDIAVGMSSDLLQDPQYGYGTFKDGVIAFPAGALFAFDPETGRGNLGNPSGQMKIVLPGTPEPAPEPEMSLTYTGMYVDADQNYNAVVDFQFNDQITEVKALLVDAKKVTEDQYNTYYDKIIKDENSGAQVITEAGKKLVAVPGDGDYVVLAVGFNAEGAAALRSNCEFTIDAGAAPAPSMEDYFGTYTMNAKYQYQEKGMAKPEIKDYPASKVTIEKCTLYKEQNLYTMKGLFPPSILETAKLPTDEGFVVGVHSGKKGIMLEGQNPLQLDAKNAVIWQTDKGNVGAMVFVGSIDQDGKLHDGRAYLSFDEKGNLVQNGNNNYYYVFLIDVTPEGAKISYVDNVMGITLSKGAAPAKVSLSAAALEAVSAQVNAKIQQDIMVDFSFRTPMTNNAVIASEINALPEGAQVESALKLQNNTKYQVR